jgi:transposase
MEEHPITARKTYHYKLRPTPEQEQVLETVLWRCCVLYNTALEQRRVWWGRGQGKGASYYQQKAELPDVTCSPCLKARGFSVQPRRQPRESPKALSTP